MKNGFTLIELMIIICIICMAIAAVLPAFVKSDNTSETAFVNEFTENTTIEPIQAEKNQNNCN